MPSLFESVSGGGRAVRSATDVRALVEKFFGRGVTIPRGVVHVVAVVALPNRLGVYQLNGASPSSPHDAFVLGFVRASVGAIVTTGKVLRAEPALRHELPGDGETIEALRDWRRSVVGMRERARSVILTSGHDIDLSHPLFGDRQFVTIITRDDAPGRFVRLARDLGIEVIQRDQTDIRQVVAILESEYELASISIEAGPSTAKLLYQPMVVNELFLSVFEGPAGGVGFVDDFYSVEALRKRFQRFASHRVDGPQGSWTFYHLVRPEVRLGDEYKEGV